MTQQDYPLAGVRVLDLSRVLAGPFAGRMLSDLGADVVKIEPPDGDITRIWGAKINGIAGYYMQQNAGKRNVCIDLSNDVGTKLVHRLVEKADILLENYRPGVMKRLGLDWETLSAINPRLIMLSISGFGQNGPESQRAAYASIVHAEAGIIARQAERNKIKPIDPPLSIADTNAGLHGLVGLLSALYMRERTGIGQHVDIAMLDATMATDDYTHFALEMQPGMNVTGGNEIWDTQHGPIIVAGDFRFIWKMMTEKCNVQDPTPPGAELKEKIRLRRQAASDFLMSFDKREDLIAALDKMNIAWGDVKSGKDIYDSPTVKSRSSITEIDDRDGGKRPVVQSPYRFSTAKSGVRGGPSYRGEHNTAVLSEWLSLPEAEISSLQDAGALLFDERGA